MRQSILLVVGLIALPFIWDSNVYANKTKQVSITKIPGFNLPIFDGHEVINSDAKNSLSVVRACTHHADGALTAQFTNFLTSGIT